MLRKLETPRFKHMDKLSSKPISDSNHTDKRIVLFRGLCEGLANLFVKGWIANILDFIGCKGNSVTSTHFCLYGMKIIIDTFKYMGCGSVPIKFY